MGHSNYKSKPYEAMFSLKTIILTCALFSVGFSGGSSSKKSCKALYAPSIKLQNKISGLSESDYVKLEKLNLEVHKQKQKDDKDGRDKQVEILKKEHAVKGQKEKYKQCLQAEKDEREARKSANEKSGKISRKYDDSEAGKNAEKWRREFNN